MRATTACWRYANDGKEYDPVDCDKKHPGWLHATSAQAVMKAIRHGIRVVDPDADLVQSGKRSDESNNRVAVLLVDHSSTNYEYHYLQYRIEDIVSEEELQMAIQSIAEAL